MIRFFVEEHFVDRALIPNKCLRSFCALVDCVNFIRELQYQIVPVTAQAMQKLDTLQRLHQELFGKAYDVDQKPKHHYRMHLPSMWLKAGHVISCEPLESKHQVYKSGVADRQRSTVKSWSNFSHAVLARLLRFNVDILVKNGLPFWQLLAPIRTADLDDRIAFATMELYCSESCLVAQMFEIHYFCVSLNSLPAFHNAVCPHICCISQTSEVNTVSL